MSAVGDHLADLRLVLARVPLVRFVRDQVDAAAGAVPDEQLSHLVQLDVLHPQLEGPAEPGHQRDADDAGDEAGADLDAVGPLVDVGRGRVDEDRRDRGERHRLTTLPGAAGRQRHRHRRRGDEDQDAGGVRAALGVDVGPEDDRDDERDGGEDQHQRPDGLGPLRRHAVAGQVARDQVQQAGHRRGAGEPEDGDGGEVVGGAERGSEVLVGQVGQGPAVRLTARLERTRRDQPGGHQAAGDQERRSS